MNKILIAHQRTGSTWVAGFGAKSCKNKITNLLDIIEREKKENPWNGTWDGKYEAATEFFVPLTKFNVPYEYRMNLLERERSEGREYFLKYMVDHLYQNDALVFNWYKNFYKKTEKVKLYNHDAWRVFLSWSYQQYCGWDWACFWKSKDYKPNFPYTVKPAWIYKFAKQYVDYIKFDVYDTSLNFHDLNDDILYDFFGIKKEQYRTKKRETILDYESNLLSADNIKNILHHELKNNGLQISDYVL